MLKKPTPIEVLIVLHRIAWKRTVFITGELARSGTCCSSALLLRRLRDLQRSKYIETDGQLRGFYGFEWTITDAGKEALRIAGIK